MRYLFFTILFCLSSGQAMGTSFSSISSSSGGYISFLPCDEGRGISIEVPIVKTYASMRQEVEWQEAKPIHKNGKIVVYKNYLLINEPDKGIHVYENIKPETPEPLGFINVPGNTDLMVRNDVIYADSFVDLVLIDFSSVENIKEINRSINIYQPNPYRFNSFDFRRFAIDTENELIVGSETVCVAY